MVTGCVIAILSALCVGEFIYILQLHGELAALKARPGAAEKEKAELQEKVRDLETKMAEGRRIVALLADHGCRYDPQRRTVICVPKLP